MWLLELHGRGIVVRDGLAGCLFYGAFASKVLVIRMKHLPGWTLPVAGSLVFTGLVAAWLTSAFWFFSTRGLQFS